MRIFFNDKLIETLKRANYFILHVTLFEIHNVNLYGMMKYYIIQKHVYNTSIALRQFYAQGKRALLICRSMHVDILLRILLSAEISGK